MMILQNKILLLLFAFRIIFDGVLWRTLPLEYAYIYELSVILLAAWFYRTSLASLLKPKFNSYTAIVSIAFPLLGLATFRLMSPLGLVFPMDLRDAYMLTIALAIAPILEEGLFRFVLWNTFDDLKVKPFFLILLTSLLFSFSHFLSYFYLTDILQDFILFQTAYTFILSILLGVVRMRSGSLTICIWAHFLYNLGFVAAYFL